MPIRQFIGACGLALLSSTSAHADDGSLRRAREAVPEIERLAERTRQELAIPGLALGVMVDGEVLLAEGYGRPSQASGHAVDADTIFAIGSCSKAFTAFVLAQLVDEGQISWNTPVQEWLPDFELQSPELGRHITVADLLAHRTGLPRHDAVWYGSQIERSELVKRLRHLDLKADLRETFLYNNLMYAVAGELIEAITGKSWEQEVQERIFEPLAMHRSCCHVGELPLDNVAMPHRRIDDVITQLEWRRFAAVAPAGSINASVRELLSWLEPHVSRDTQLLSTQRLNDMHEPAMLLGSFLESEGIQNLGYGYGWMEQLYYGERLSTHSGGIDGFISMVGILPEHNAAFVILSNSEDGFAAVNALSKSIMDRVLGLPCRDWVSQCRDELMESHAHRKEAAEQKSLAAIPDTLPSHELGAYCGSFSHSAYGRLTVDLVSDQLELRYNGSKIPLQHVHYDVFEADERVNMIYAQALKVQFLTNLGGEICSLKVPFEEMTAPIEFERAADPQLLDPDYLQRFVGDYEGPGGLMRIALQEQALHVKADGQPECILEPRWGDRFGVQGFPSFTMHFVSDAEGAVVELRSISPHGVFIMTPV